MSKPYFIVCMVSLALAGLCAGTAASQDPSTSYAVFAPAGTLPAIVARLNQEIGRYLQSAEGKSAFLKGGIESVSSSPEELTATIKSEMATLGKVLRAAGINPP